MVLLPYKTLHFLWRLPWWQHYGSLSDSYSLQESTTGWNSHLLQFYIKQKFYTVFFFSYWLFVWLIQCFLIKKVKNLLAYKKYSQDFFSTMIFEVLQNKIYNGIERKKYKLIQYRRYKNKKKVYVIFGCYCKLLYPNGIKGYKRLPLNLFDSNHSDLLIVIFNKNWITKKQCFD